MTKKVPLTTKPQTPRQATPDEWVSATLAANPTTAIPQEEEAPDAAPNLEEEVVPLEPMKRLTIDVPQSLHKEIKSRCALRGVKMADEIRVLLERHFLQHD